MLSTFADLKLTAFQLAAVPISAQSFVETGVLASLTNSIFVALIVMAIIYFLVRAGTKNATLIPGPMQNGVEFVFEFLYNQVEQVVGPKVAPRAFPLLCTIFIYILVANWFGLMPGVGSIGFGHEGTQMGLLGLSEEPRVPLLRPATADMNLTIGIAVCAMLVWFYITMRETGPIEFLKHMFAPKGGLTGVMWWALLPIFLFVGVIEVVSIMFRPVTLSLRLFGNVFAGENLLHAMSNLGAQLGLGSTLAFFSKILFTLPFYFLEILVGVLQATVFALLCAVYIQLSTAHDEEEH
jgi:F-type H+-transporting ATPase subunit a